MFYQKHMYQWFEVCKTNFLESYCLLMISSDFNWLIRDKFMEFGKVRCF